jgi:hypothetical protein
MGRQGNLRRTPWRINLGPEILGKIGDEGVDLISRDIRPAIDHRLNRVSPLIETSHRSQKSNRLDYSTATLASDLR